MENEQKSQTMTIEVFIADFKYFEDKWSFEEASRICQFRYDSKDEMNKSLELSDHLHEVPNKIERYHLTRGVDIAQEADDFFFSVRAKERIKKEFVCDKQYFLFMISTDDKGKEKITHLSVGRNKEENEKWINEKRAEYLAMTSKEKSDIPQFGEEYHMPGDWVRLGHPETEDETPEISEQYDN